MSDFIKNLQNAISSGDISDVRSSFTAEIAISPSKYREFREGAKLVEVKMPEVFENFSGIDINTNKSLWTNEYCTEQEAELSLNFSIKRLRHVIEVIEYLQEGKKKQTSKTTTENIYQTSQEIRGSESNPVAQNAKSMKSKKKEVEKREELILKIAIATVAFGGVIYLASKIFKK